MYKNIIRLCWWKSKIFIKRCRNEKKIWEIHKQSYVSILCTSLWFLRERSLTSLSFVINSWWLSWFRISIITSIFQTSVYIIYRSWWVLHVQTRSNCAWVRSTTFENVVVAPWPATIPSISDRSPYSSRQTFFSSVSTKCGA